MLLLESQLAARWTYPTAAYFHGAPDTQRGHSPASICITGHVCVDVAGKCQAPSHLTPAPFPMGSEELSLSGLFPFSLPHPGS